MSGINLLLGAERGIYIPKDFVQGFKIKSMDDEGWEGITAEMVADCQDPESEFYWDSWGMILDRAKWVDALGNMWLLYQDGDLFAICPEIMTDEEFYNFFGEYRETSDNDN